MRRCSKCNGFLQPDETVLCRYCNNQLILQAREFVKEFSCLVDSHLSACGHAQAEELRVEVEKRETKSCSVEPSSTG